jgi:5-formyltetrahydrofolate cyclo-ligase
MESADIVMGSDPLARASQMAEAKQAARNAAQAARKAAHLQLRETAGADVAARVNTVLNPEAGTVVSAFLSIGSEVDTSPLIQMLRERACRVALPCVEGPARPLIFRAYEDGQTLVAEPFGTRAPGEDAPILVPDILLVPLLAFDRAGYRLGYGGGFYDRTLEGLRAHKPVLAVGIAYSAQEVDAVPREATDQPLDWIVSEREAFQP